AGVREVDTADRRGRRHREALGQIEPGGAGAEQVEELRLLAVVGTGRVAERRPNAWVALAQEGLPVEVLVGRVPLAAGASVEPLGERLREAVGERLDDDRAVVVVLGA